MLFNVGTTNVGHLFDHRRSGMAAIPKIKTWFLEKAYLIIIVQIFRIVFDL